jgi:hypothetical protein
MLEDLDNFSLVDSNLNVDSIFGEDLDGCSLGDSNCCVDALFSGIFVKRHWLGDVLMIDFLTPNFYLI